MLRNAEFLSNAVKNFVGEPRISHGARQDDATDHRCCVKDGFISVSTASRENLLKSLLERGFKFRGRASHLWR